MLADRKIKVLPPQLANLIAAGEVVERPASVVKELVENSIDAGAKNITVEIKNGGVTYIRVTDDGKGIPSEDAKTAFLRHATSKIEKESDLEAIMTMGFRGEALAALAAVSRVDMFTREWDKSEGRHVCVEGGELTDDSETGCPAGTNIVVRDLFYNVPARSKFMKKDSTEASKVEEAVINAAIANPKIAFKFIKDNRDGFQTTGNGSLQDVMHEVAGKDVAHDMMLVATEISGIKVGGFVAGPKTNRGTRGMQGFFVNGRPVRSKTLTAAVDEAYKGRLMVGRFAVYYLMLRMHPSLVDVNIHPAKLEVKFARERDVFLAVRNAVSAVLDSADMQKAMELEEEQKQKRENAKVGLSGYGSSGITASNDYLSVNSDISESKVAAAPASGGFGYGGQASRHSGFIYGSVSEAKSSPKNTEAEKTPPAQKNSLPNFGYLFTPSFEEEPKQEVIEEFKSDTVAPIAEIEAKTEKKECIQPACEDTEEIKVIGELFRTYIVAQDHDGVWLIDKHAVHEREIYNRLRDEGASCMEQLLCTPKVVVLSRNEKQTLLDNTDTVSQLGFDISDLGGPSVVVRSIPSYIDEDEIAAVLSEIAEKLTDNKSAEPDVFDSLLKSVACKSAVKAGMKSELFELKKLAKDVLTQKNLQNCPHGRPTAIKLTRREIEKMFKRIV